MVAKLNCIGYQSRSDVCFEAKILSTKFGNATKIDLKAVYKKIRKLKLTLSRIIFPNLGDTEDWVLVGHGNTTIKSMSDKVTSWLVR